MSATAVAEPNAALRHPTPILYDLSCRPLLTDDLRAALESLISLLTRAAARQRVPVLRLDVCGFSDPEEDNAQVVVRQWVRLPPREALSYWDSLSPDYEAWLRSCVGLMPDAAERLTFEIRWTENAPTL